MFESLAMDCSRPFFARGPTRAGQWVSASTKYHLRQSYQVCTTGDPVLLEQSRTAARKEPKAPKQLAIDCRRVVLELQDRLKKQDIDVCLVQETKLRLTHRTQTIKGYGAVRSDRKGGIGGCLIIYIKNTLVF